MNSTLARLYVVAQVIYYWPAPMPPAPPPLKKSSEQVRNDDFLLEGVDFLLIFC